MKIMPVNGNYANQKNNNKSKVSDAMAFGMKVQLDMDSVVITLDKVKNSIVRVKIMTTITDAIDRLNRDADTLFRGVMDRLYAPKDIQPKDIEGYGTAIAKLQLKAETPTKGFTRVVLDSKDFGTDGKDVAIADRPPTFEMAISDAFDKFANNSLKQSELFQRRMVEARQTAEDEYAKLLGRKIRS